MLTCKLKNKTVFLLSRWNNHWAFFRLNSCQVHSGSGGVLQSNRKNSVPQHPVSSQSFPCAVSPGAGRWDLLPFTKETWAGSLRVERLCFPLWRTCAGLLSGSRSVYVRRWLPLPILELDATVKTGTFLRDLYPLWERNHEAWEDRRAGLQGREEGREAESHNRTHQSQSYAVAGTSRQQPWAPIRVKNQAAQLVGAEVEFTHTKRCELSWWTWPVCPVLRPLSCKLLLFGLPHSTTAPSDTHFLTLGLLARVTIKSKPLLLIISPLV